VRQRSARDLARPLCRRSRRGDRRAIGRAAVVRSMAMVLRILSRELSQYRSEDVIPKGCANAVVSRREFMMALVMFEQW
jgi:hypothetical protein